MPPSNDSDFEGDENFLLDTGDIDIDRLKINKGKISDNNSASKMRDFQDPSQNSSQGPSQDPIQDSNLGQENLQDPSQDLSQDLSQDPSQDPSQGLSQGPSQDSNLGQEDFQDSSQGPSPDPSQGPNLGSSQGSNLDHASKEITVSKKVHWKGVLTETNDGTPFIPQHEKTKAAALTVALKSNIADDHPMKTDTIVELNNCLYLELEEDGRYFMKKCPYTTTSIDQ